MASLGFIETIEFENTIDQTLDFDIPETVQMLRTPRKPQEAKADAGGNGDFAKSATTPGAAATGNKWQSSLRSARKATAAVLGRGQNQGQEKEKEKEQFLTPQTTKSSLISSTPLAKGVQGEPIDFSDSFSFAPMSLTVPADFVPVSSCDDIEPTFEARSPSGLGMSSNFSKLLSNAMKVDQVRHNAKKASLQSVMDPNKTVDDLQQELEASYAKLQLQQQQKQAEVASLSPSSSPSSPGVDEKEKNSIQKPQTLSVEESQKRLIDQLKQGLNYIARENKQLKISNGTLEKELRKEKAAYVEKLTKKHKEVEERNLKLAVLEAHFCQLNNASVNEEEHAPSDASGNDEGAEGNDNVPEGEGESDELTNDGGKLDDSKTEASPVKQTAVSSIIQIDKGYYNDLEDTVKRETAQRKQVEEFNRDMVAKYNQLVKDSGNEAKEMKDQISRQERTISTLEQNLKQMRQAKFKQKKGKGKSSKGHRRRATVSAVPSDDELLVGLDDHDEYSMSAASSTINSNYENEPELQEGSKNGGDIKKEETVNINEAIEAAVSKALEEKEKEHSSNMEVFSKQLELKDKIISRLESKMFGLVKNKNDTILPSSHRPNRAVPKDVMVRSIAVTNELMDSSIRRLETMLARLERTDENDEIAPIRRMALKVSSVHEEMKVSMKLIELRVDNQVEAIRQKCGEGHASEDEKGDKGKQGGQTSGENVESTTSQESIEDLIAKVQSEAIKSLKETESSVKKEIDSLKEQLETIEFDLAEKADTIEALELACAEHVKKFLSLQEQYEGLQSTSDN